MGVSIREIERLASLARLELGTKEKKKFTNQLSSILEYVEKINELELSHGKDVKDNQTRARAKMITDARLDQVEDFNNPENLIKQAPRSKNNLVRTHPVF